MFNILVIIGMWRSNYHFIIIIFSNSVYLSSVVYYSLNMKKAAINTNTVFKATRAPHIPPFIPAWIAPL